MKGEEAAESRKHGALREELLSEVAFFDQFVETAAEFNPFHDRAWRRLERAFQETCGLEPGSALCVLDVGCGTGSSRQVYGACLRDYVGLDISERELEIARRSFPSDQWVWGDALAMPFEDASFDVVAFSAVLHHISDFGLALKEAARVVKPGGQVFAFDPNVCHPAMALLRHPRSPLYLKAGVSPNERPLSRAQLLRAFEAAGLNSVVIYGIADLPYKSVAPKLINALLGIYNPLDRFLEWSRLARLIGPMLVSRGVR